MSYTKIASTKDIDEGTMSTFDVDGKKIAIANIDGEYFGIDDTCSHAQCSLGDEGFLDGSSVICGCHGATFNAKDGKVMSLPATEDVASYKVKVEGDDIMVSV